jgi:hypothetical protein
LVGTGVVRIFIFTNENVVIQRNRVKGNGANARGNSKMNDDRESRLWAATAGFPDLGSAGDVGLEFRHFAETLGKAFQQLPMKSSFGRGKGIVAPQARLTDQNQIGLAQVGQVPGDARLWSLQDFYDVSDAKFRALQDVENPQPRSVGKCPEHQVGAAEHFGLCAFGHLKSLKLVFAYSTA